MSKDIKVEITNLQSGNKVNRPLLRKVLMHTMREAEVSGTLSLAVVDSEEITELNRRFLGRAQPTDVMSFALQDETSDLFGEVVICADVAAQEAGERGIDFDSELALYALHGLLHLLGYDDETDQMREQMQNREQEILSQFGISIR
jgi:rRNA maturation RNase YbeY